VRHSASSNLVDPTNEGTLVDLSQLTVEVEHRFAAPPAAVFALLTDVERMAGLGPEHQTARWTDRGRTRFTGVNQLGDLQWEVTCVVVENEPPRAFGWTVGEPGEQSSTWSYALVPDGDGTLVTQRFAHGPGMTYLRQLCEAKPERAEVYVARRSADLRSNMLAVLSAAEALLTTGTPRAG
jgi:uncharacterized protein YndB with AHSA1/START domain